MTPLIVFEKPREVVHTPMIDNIHRLEQAMIDSGKELLGEGDITHFFTPGMYVREIHMPKDTLWTTKVHKTEHVFIISKGKVAVHQLKPFECSPLFGLNDPHVRALVNGCISSRTKVLRKL